MSPTELAGCRARIDQIDAVLVRLIAARQRQVAIIAGLKPGPDQVRDQKRVAAILVRIRSAARRHGLDEQIAVPVWRELLERSAQSQQALLREIGAKARLDEGQAAQASPSRRSQPRSSMKAASPAQESP